MTIAPPLSADFIIMLLLFFKLSRANLSSRSRFFFPGRTNDPCCVPGKVCNKFLVSVLSFATVSIVSPLILLIGGCQVDLFCSFLSFE